MKSSHFSAYIYVYNSHFPYKTLYIERKLVFNTLKQISRRMALLHVHIFLPFHSIIHTKML